ncbi:MAG: hypothetical protein GY943_05050 [Chloroflexi bacterium]|nr:hypothetical protein [Chloroflexota bacterium]
MIKKLVWIPVTLIFLILLLVGCTPPETTVDIAGTVDIEVAQGIALTLEAQSTPTTASATEESVSETAVKTATPLPATPLPLTLEASTETAVPANTGNSLTRRELFAILASFNTAVYDQITLIEQLLFTPNLEEQAWLDEVTASSNAIQTSYDDLLAMDVPRQGTQPHTRAVDAIAFCNEMATAVATTITTADAAQLEALEEGLGNCTNELVSLTAAFEQDTRQGDSPVTPAPVFESLGCSGTSTGFIPLIDLGLDTYQGFEGGLYPSGVNTRPPAHEAAGLALATQIAPINGRIVMLSIGMSNTRHESDQLIAQMTQDSEINPQVLFVNGAISGRAAQTIDSETADYWDLVDKRLARADTTAEQVQVVWLKQAHAYPGLPFPQDAQDFETELNNIVHIIGQKYPNVKMVYLSSRIYAGYASATLHPEPYAYQSGFSVKWLIEDYIDGQLPDAPWIAWGPYMWADGTTPRSDGLIWECDDLIADGTHPSDLGREKVATMLIDFFKTDTTTRVWFLRQP